ncbi:MAG: single-stranded DNA-binding protein [Bacteroidales bacterium]|nr:single-stranded DNA-binding protein [Bacteroidales bacterium]
MLGLNKVLLIGYVGRDPEIKVDNPDNKKVSFSLGVSTMRRDNADNTEWFNISAWGKLAEIVEKYVKKGMPVYIEGKFRSYEFTDNQNNQRKGYEVVADNVIMLSSKDDKFISDSIPNEQPYNNIPIHNDLDADDNFEPSDDLPF